MLDRFQIYLIIVNALAFLAFTIDFHVYVRTGREVFNHAALCLFAVAGGPAGMLLAFLIWDRRVVKRNVAWRFVAIGMLVLWVVIIANVYGFHRFDLARLMHSLNQSHQALLYYLASINVITFAVFVVDKAKAIRGSWRIREGVLMGLALTGGSVGGMMAMIVARHKINTPYFAYGLPVMLVLQIVVVAYLLQAGLV